MNRKIKILLSIVIVSLSALVIPLKGHNENIKTSTKKEHTLLAESAEIQVKQMNSSRQLSINFEIDEAVKEMNQKMTEIESVQDKKEWFIAYKNIIDEYLYIIDPPETIYDYFSAEELDLLFHVVQAEVGDEYSFEQKSNVAEVIFNRLEHERFPDVLPEILTPDQFQPISNGSYKKAEVSEDTILACEYAFQIGTGKEECLFFDSNNTLNYEFVWNDGIHNFYKYRED
ncbi:MAG: cell wall hydrolase [Candidatus Gastranaerophilales bacterium]|nr:cell wall hydrolase [Candidatus Gastranaerophilales bacterium]